MSQQPTISVVSATLNAVNYLPRLIDSLAAQTDTDFEWIIADGLSIDGTFQLLSEIRHINIKIYRQTDFGIYDALNRAIAYVKTDYYLVVGADDYLAPDAIEQFRKAACSNNFPDFVAASVFVGGKMVRPRSGWGWLFGMPGESSSHSVGLLIKRALHESVGFYSRKFPITADQLFFFTALKSGCRVSRHEFVAGEFGVCGASGSDDWGMITELFRVQILVNRWIFPQMLLLFSRCIKCYLKGVFKK